MRSRIRRPNVGSSRLGEKSRSTTECTFLFAVGASFACPRGRPQLSSQSSDCRSKCHQERDCSGLLFFSGMSVADQASQCWWAVIERTGMFCAHAVPYKGAGVEWVAQQMARDISKCGYHGRVVLRSDQEPALQDLKGQVARLRGDLPTVLEASPVGDSQSNGFVESSAID